jgi:small redox-active disulfide protein 2
MHVKILGKGCPKCKRLEQLAHDAAEEADIDATFSKVMDMDAILAYDVSMTPGLVIDEVVKSSGRIPSKQEIVAWMREAAA